MSAPIGPGDWVECVDASPCPVFGPCGLALGGLYQVEDVHVDAGCLDGWSVTLRQVRSAAPLGRFGGRRFRPIYRPKQSVIEKLKQPAPEREIEHA